MDFSSSEEGNRFCSSGAARRTSEAVLYAIALHAKDAEQAETIWADRTIPGRTVRQSEDAVYETAKRNFPVSTLALVWHGSAAWAVAASGRLLASAPAARWPSGPVEREPVFDQHGIKIVRENGSLVMERRTDSRLCRNYLSEEQAGLAMRSEQALKHVIEEVNIRSRLPLDGKAAVRLVQDHLAGAANAWDHAAAGVREHDGRWAVAMQPFDMNGIAVYQCSGFDAESNSGTLTQTI